MPKTAPLHRHDALSYAKSVKQPGDIRWRALEVAAFHSHPQIQRALDSRQQYGRYPRRLSWSTVFTTAFIVVSFLVLVAGPLLAVVSLGAGYGRGVADPSVAPENAVPFVGAVFALSAAGQLIVYASAAVGHRDKIQAATLTYLAAWNLILSTVAWLRTGLLVRSLNLPDFSLWQNFILSCMLVSSSGLLLSCLAKLTATSSSQQPAPMALAVKLIAKLSPQQQDLVRKELEDALTHWQNKNWLDETEVQQATTIPLGLLAVKMPPPKAAR